MDKFIAVSQQAREDLDNRISGTSFGSVNSFIEFYNADLINKNATLVKELLEEIVSTYKDIEVSSRKIIFLDPSEVYLSETLKELQPWTLLTGIKREVQTALETGKLDYGDLVVFTPKATGIVCKLVTDDEGNRSFAKVGVEKLFNKPDAVQEIFDRYSTTRDGADGTYSFRVEDFSNLDDSFIQRIHELIPRR